MAELNQYRVPWTNLKGMPGVSTFYSSGLDPLQLKGKIETFFTAMKPFVPGATTWTMPNTGLIIDEASGQATGVWGGGTATVIGGSGTGSYHAAGGAVVNWKTSLFVAGRQLRGKTFLVPLTVGQYESDGTLSNSMVSTILTAANAMTGGTSPLVCWSKKLGTSAPVTSATVPDKAVVLRSRRD